jgi:hypothetical protein
MATPATPTRAPALRQDDFVWGEFLGKGAFGRVMAAKRKDNGQDVAIKILDKAQIQKLDKMKYVKVCSILLTCGAECSRPVTGTQCRWSATSLRN